MSSETAERLDTKKVRMLRTIGSCVAGQVYELPRQRALYLVSAGVASLRLLQRDVKPAAEADPDVEVLGKAPKKAPKNRMVTRSVQKGG